ncbi:MAG: hypothetical protein GF320_21945 [Armatimonadia bacterium]|nr:hypothetical protein [Armatimonadia bacterium]
MIVTLWLLVIALSWILIGLLTLLAELMPHDREWRGWTPVVRVLTWPAEWFFSWITTPKRGW